MRRKSILWVIEKFADGGAGGVLSLDHGGRPKCLDFGEIRGVGKEDKTARSIRTGPAESGLAL